uniref:protease-associated domain-containing protein 1 n=1 Tax=Monopterus albus TaxID=43700 RepID=UPI0009B2FD0B|nr:protease-associated domain-containing protein 1 [Monopterus albus]
MSWNMAKFICTKALVLYIWSVFMQLSRMSGLGVNELLYFRVISPEEIGYIFSAAPAKDFGGDFTSSYDEIFLVPANPADGCSDLTDRDTIRGQVILVERGSCSFVQKARHVEEAGGKAVLIADNAEDNDSQYLDMITDGSTVKPSIPALFLMMIRRSLQRQALPWAVISIPVNISSLASFPLKQPPWTLWMQLTRTHTVKLRCTDEGNPQLNPSRVRIVLEGIVVMDELANLPQAFCVLFGLIYALHLDYPKYMKNTFYFVQQVMLNLGKSQLAPKNQTLKNQLAV